MTPEKQVQTNIIKYLKSLMDQGYPVWFERRQAGGYSYKKGIPDIYGIVNGRHFEIEVKKPGGTTTPLQDKFAIRMKNVGALYILADSLITVKKEIEQFL